MQTRDVRMRSKVRGTGRPFVNKDPSPENARNRTLAVGEMVNKAKEITLKRVSIEERRKEANKPLYLVRYE